MTPRTGRPTINPKNVSLQLRLTKDAAEKLKYCSDQLNISRTDIVIKGIDLVKAKLDKKKE